MNISYRWLQALAPGLKLTPEEVAARLASMGSPVEGIEDLAAELKDVVIARVASAGQHPNADRLSLCEVEGPDGVVQVVCGAPNVKAGAWYPFAPVGSTLPGGLVLKKAKIRGETSNGMLCSARELGLGEDHEGILELDGDFTVGESFVDSLGLSDWRMDVETTANRGDLLSHLGVAREVVADTDLILSLPDIPGARPLSPEYLVGEASVEAGGTRVEIRDPELCWRYLGAVIRGVTVGPSPDWLAGRIRAAGGRPINNVVDATNYVLLELGQPLHAFDLSTLKEQTIVVRTPARGEGDFTTLDGEKRKLGTDMLLICDADQPVALAGVMGGGDSEVSGTTTDVLLECALFQPARTRATRRALNMSTDASYRYERGVDPEGLERAIERCIQIILATAGGELEGPILDCSPRPALESVVELRPGRVEKVLGVPFSQDQITALIAPLGFEIQNPGTGDGAGEDPLRVRVPGYRSYDVTREVDLIEEIARTHGYDEFPEELGSFRPGTVPDDALFQVQDRLRDALVSAGLLEAQTPPFAPEDEGEVSLLNPISAEETALRGRLLPALLRRLEYNWARGARDVRIFETGTVFGAPPEVGAPPLEETHIALVLTGLRNPPHWSGAGEPVDLWDLKGLATEVAGICWPGSTLGAEESDAPSPEARLDSGQSLRIEAPGGTVVGWLGRVSPQAMDAPVWAGDVFALEMKLQDPPRPVPPPVFHDLPPFPGADRDLAVILPAGVTVAQAEAVIRQAARKYLTDVTVFDVYEGEGIAQGTRSVAFRLHFQSWEKTLTDRDVDKAADRAIGRLKEELGVETRGR